MRTVGRKKVCNCSIQTESVAAAFCSNAAGSGLLSSDSVGAVGNVKGRPLGWTSLKSAFSAAWTWTSLLPMSSLFLASTGTGKVDIAAWEALQLAADDVEVSEAGRGEVEPPAAAISDSFPSFGDENSVRFQVCSFICLFSFRIA